MQEETKQTLATVTIKGAVKALGKDNVDSLALSEHLADELPGLSQEASTEILEYALRLLPYVRVRVDVDEAIWRIQDQEELHCSPDGSTANDPGAVW